MEIQLSLFTEEPIAIESRTLEWSYSRREALERCPRQYYYLYYAAHSRHALSDPQKSDIKFLKQLTNRYMRAGDILHLVISSYLRRLQEGEERQPSGYLAWAKTLLREDITFSSRVAADDPPPEQQYAPARLLEFHYDHSGAHELLAEVEERMLTALERFFALEELEPFRNAARRTDSRIESNSVFTHRDFRLRGKLDLCFWLADRFTVVDWKMGSARGSEDSLQLFFYAWAAMKKFGATPEQIDLYRVHLGSSDIEKHSFSPRQLARTEARILQDLRKIQLLDRYGRDGVADAFTPYGHEKVCNLCPFQGPCPKE